MKDGFVKVAAATPNLRVADSEYNAEEIIALSRQAAGIGVKVLVFPELCITGYSCADLLLHDTLLDNARLALSRIITETKDLDIFLTVGLPIRCKDDSKIYNCAAAICHGKILGLVPKTWIPNYGEFYERRWFSPAPRESKEVELYGMQVAMSASCVFTCRSMPELRLGIEICEDLWVPAPVSTDLVRKSGATVILNLSASNELVGKAAYRRELIKSQSARLICGYIYASAGTGESSTDLVFSGHDIIAENGSVLAENRFQSGLTISEIDVKRISFDRGRMSTFTPNSIKTECNIGFDLEADNTFITRSFSKNPFVPGATSERSERCREIFSIQTSALMKRMKHSEAKHMVLGISGGLDSTLASLVCAETAKIMSLLPLSISAVTMPCFGTTERTKSNAILLSEELGVNLRVIDISKTVTQHLSDIGHSLEERDVVFENAQARERTQVLMDIANDINGLVVGTGDLSELALGWTTYNGDHMSMYAVNIGVPKTLVRYIVRWYADTCNNHRLAVILNDILDTPVSPELLPPKAGVISQKTEELVGPYELHDFFLYYFVRWGFSPAKIYRLAKIAYGEDYSDDVIKKWLEIFMKRFFSQQFKRSCLPDGPKVGSVSLSPRGDWRMPSDAQVSIWLSELNCAYKNSHS